MQRGKRADLSRSPIQANKLAWHGCCYISWIRKREGKFRSCWPGTTVYSWFISWLILFHYFLIWTAERTLLASEDARFFAFKRRKYISLSRLALADWILKSHLMRKFCPNPPMSRFGRCAIFSSTYRRVVIPGWTQTNSKPTNNIDF